MAKQYVYVVYHRDVGIVVCSNKKRAEVEKKNMDRHYYMSGGMGFGSSIKKVEILE